VRHVFVKKKNCSGKMLIHAVHGDVKSIVEEIKRRLGWVEPPAFLDDFEKEVVESLTLWVWGERPCSTARIYWDENPSVHKRKYLSKEGEVIYTKEYHVDTIVCDGKRYELEAEYEFYETPDGFIVHSFKPIDVREASE
jgi:hypothetical protein